MSSIAEDTMSCLHALHTLATTLPAACEEYRTEMPVKKVIDERDRLKIWAGSLGALQTGTKALTFRLRESPIMENNVKKLLRRLVNILTECLEITTGVRAPLETNKIPTLSKDSEYSSDSDSDDDSPRTELGQQMMSITSVLSDLYKLAFKIRNRATRPMSHKPAVYDETVQVDDNTRVSIFASYEKYDRQFVEDSLLHLRKHFKIEPHQHSPNTTSQERPQCTDALAERLARNTTTRRRILRYWQRHAEKLAHVDEEKGNEEKGNEENGKEEKSNEGITRLQGAVSKDPRTITSGSGRPTMTGTEATTYNPVHDSTPDTVSVISFASTSFDTEGNTIEIPIIPSSLLQLPGFVCPYCGILIPSREGTGRAWKNHVLKDLMPYFCTYADCLDGMRMYSSRRDWIEHEKMAHLKEWRCFNHTDTAFKSSSELRRHIEVEDSTSVSQSQVQTLVILGERNSPDTRTMCPICFLQGPFSKGLTNHIAFHLERFALFSIKGHFFETQADSGDDDDSKIVHGLGSSTASDKSSISFTVDVDRSVGFDTLQSNSSPPHSPLPISNIETRDIDPRAVIFQIHEIAGSPNAPDHYDQFGRWIPSTDRGANIRVSGGVSGSQWCFNGRKIYKIPGLLSGFSKYSTHSMYYSGGHGLLILRGDATTGTETESWLPPRFDHDKKDYSSFLTNAGGQPQLLSQRLDQLWPTMLLPDIYHAPVRTKNERYGGLTGELGILLALIALSVPQEHLQTVLPAMYREGSWQVHSYRAPRQNQRGVVVEVWASDFPTLGEMERGYFGKYYS